MASCLTLETDMNKMRFHRLLILIAFSLCYTQNLFAKKGLRSPVKAITQTEQFRQMQSASDETAAYQEKK
jgi:hypothetical protein